MDSNVYMNYRWLPQVYGATFKVEFPKMPDFNMLVLSADLHQEMEEHDYLILRIKGKPFKKEFNLAYGDPVKFTYKSGKKDSVFVGKVNSVKQEAGLNGVAETVVRCVSASSVLKNSGQKIYKKVTADQVVARVCEQHGLRAVTQRDPRVRSAIVHSGETFWQLLRSLAKQTGFALRAENTTVTFCSKDKITESKKKSAPYFLYIDGKTNGTINPALRALGTVISYRHITSDGAPETASKVDRVFSGQSSTTGKSVNTTHKNPTPSKNKGAVKPNESYFL